MDDKTLLQQIAAQLEQWAQESQFDKLTTLNYKYIKIMNKTTTNKLVNETVQSLRAKGFKVKVAHQRLAFNKTIQFNTPLLMPSWLVKKNPNWKICNDGGVTVVQITTPDGQNKEGVAVCVDPNFDRKMGLKIAISRALNN